MTGSNHTTTYPPPVTSACDTCGAPFTTVLHKAAVAKSCPACAYYQVLSQGLGYKKVHQFKRPVKPAIPLHAKGNIRGITWQVTGFTVKRTMGTTYDWREYTLFNPIEGFATLAEYNGHWNLVLPINDYPRFAGNKFEEVLAYGDRKFQRYARYKSTVKYAIGEFGYNTFEDKTKVYEEWIAPPFILIREKNEDELYWSLGEYITPKELEGIFPEMIVPEQTGVGATQVQKGAMSLNVWLKPSIAFVALLFIIQLLQSSLASEKKLFGAKYGKSDTDTSGLIVSPAFEVDQKSALQIDLYLDLNNDWFDLDFELVNDLTGERFEGAKSLEFYAGYDDEGSWSEGKKSDYIIISSVPQGRYHLNLYPQWDKAQLSPAQFTINAFQGPSLWANFLLFLLISLVAPVVLYLRIKSFEARRWMESDYSPSLSILES